MSEKYWHFDENLLKVSQALIDIRDGARNPYLLSKQPEVGVSYNKLYPQVVGLLVEGVTDSDVAELILKNSKDERRRLSLGDHPCEYVQGNYPVYVDLEYSEEGMPRLCFVLSREIRHWTILSKSVEDEYSFIQDLVETPGLKGEEGNEWKIEKLDKGLGKYAWVLIEARRVLEIDDFIPQGNIDQYNKFGLFAGFIEGLKYVLRQVKEQEIRSMFGTTDEKKIGKRTEALSKAAEVLGECFRVGL